MPNEQPATPAPNAEPATNLGWVKMMRGEPITELIEAAPLAFTLAAIIALRARFKSGVNLMNGTCRGEALLGDYKACGMSEQQYRTAKKQLEKWGFATFKATTKGTTGKLTDTRLFDVLSLTGNGQTNRRPTGK